MAKMSHIPTFISFLLCMLPIIFDTHIVMYFLNFTHPKSESYSTCFHVSTHSSTCVCVSVCLYSSLLANLPTLLP